MIERFAAFSKKLCKKLMNLFNGQQSRSVSPERSRASAENSMVKYFQYSLCIQVFLFQTMIMKGMGNEDAHCSDDLEFSRLFKVVSEEVDEAF